MCGVKKISISEICYFTFFVLLLVAKGIGLYDGQSIFKVLLVVAMLFWSIKMILTAYTWRELAMIVFLLVLSGGVYLVSGEKGALLYVMMIVGTKNIPIRKLFKVGLVSWGCAFGLTTWVHAVGLLEGPFKVHDKFGLGMVIRWGAGYSHPNVFHISYLLLVLLLIYILDEHFSWKWALLLMAGNMLVFLYSLSSTGVIGVTVCLMLSIYWKFRRKLGKVERILIQTVFPVCIAWSLLAPIVLQGELFQIVDDISNTRLRLANYFLTLQPPTLLGTRVSNIITNKLTMDNSYVFAFVTYGLFLFVVILTAYLLLIHRYCQQQKGKELCIMITVLIAGIMEPFMFNTSFKNISLLFMKDLIFNEEKKCEVKLLRQYDKEVTLPSLGLKRYGCYLFAVIKKRYNVILLSGILGCFVGGAAYFVLTDQPVAIIVPKIHCDIDRPNEETYIYLLSLADVNEGERVIGYIDGEAPMVRYTGNIIWLESVRGMVSSVYMMGVAGCAAAVLMILFKNRKDAGRHEEGINCK